MALCASETVPSRRRPHASILGGSLAVAAAAALRLGAGFAIAILVARVLGATAKGELALLQQLPAIAALLLGLGLEAAHAYHVGRGGWDPSGAVSDSLAYALVVSAVGIPATVLVMRLLVPALDMVSTLGVAVAAATVPLLLLTSLAGGVLTGLGRVPSQALAQTAASVVSLAIIGTLAMLGRLTLESVVVALAIALTVGAIGAMLATRVRSLPRPSLSRLRTELPYARRSYVQSVTGYLEMRQDVVLLGILGSAAGVGVYSVGVSIAELLIYAPHALGTALMARSLQEDASSGAGLTARTTRLLTAFLLITAGALALIARPLVVALFGAQFTGAATVIAILIPGVVFWGIASQPAAYLASHGRLFPRMSTATLLINFTLNLVLIPVLGPAGAAVATTISYTVISGYIIRTYTNETQTRIIDLLVVRVSDLRFAVAAARALRS